MQSRHLHVSLSLLALLTGCNLPEVPQGETVEPDQPPEQSPGTTPEPTEQDEELGDCTKQGAEVESLLVSRCGACHGNGNGQGGLSGIGDMDGLIEHGMVVPGKAAESVLYGKVETGQMPLDGERLSDGELSTLREYIDVCTLLTQETEAVSLAEKPGCIDENVVITGDDILAAIRDDIVRLDNAEAITTRYLTLSHLYGAGYCENQIEGYRHALVKLLNHLSLDPFIRAPVAIDEARTIYRINLVDYGWKSETWQSITDSDPYAINFLSEDALDIRDSADVELFAVKADWFVDAASQPPLYHTILEIPESRFLLETSLGIDVAENIADELRFDRDDVARAGFQESGVSFSNRVIERHQLPSSPRRAYWLSYDFARAADGQILSPEKDILVSPLDFQSDGGEIIFNLANGLQAYMLVDALGDRINRGPINVVHDGETIEEPEVINGLSCISCHSEGMRLKSDEVAAFVENNSDFSTKDQEDVAKLYTPIEKFAALQQQDVATFVDAMTATGALRRVGGREPLMAVHLAFDGRIDLRRAAAEFGVEESQVLKNLGKLRDMAALDGATVTRDAFQENFAFNACVLQLGATVECPDVDPL